MEQNQQSNMDSRGSICKHGTNCADCCSQCNGGLGRRGRMIMLIIATLVIFWLGYKLGEMKGFMSAVIQRGAWEQESMMPTYDTYEADAVYDNTVPADSDIYQE